MAAAVKRFRLTRDYWDKGVYLYGKNSVSFKPGVTILVGCNGSGKTTMLRQIRDQLEASGAAFMYLRYDKEREQKNDRLADGLAPFEIFASWVVSSEGEQIVVRLQQLAGEVGKLSARSKDKDLFLLLDGVDSGFSLDNIEDMKNYLFEMLVSQLRTEGRNLYILATANTYELAAGYDCVDVVSTTHRSFSDYEEYRACILESRESKRKRAEPKVTRGKTGFAYRSE